MNRAMTSNENQEDSLGPCWTINQSFLFFSPILSSYRNTSGSLGDREMLWEHEPQASVSTAFSSSPKLSRFYTDSIEIRSTCSFISLRKHRDEKKENNLLTLVIKM